MSKNLKAFIHLAFFRLDVKIGIVVLTMLYVLGSILSYTASGHNKEIITSEYFSCIETPTLKNVNGNMLYECKKKTTTLVIP